MKMSMVEKSFITLKGDTQIFLIWFLVEQVLHPRIKLHTHMMGISPELWGPYVWATIHLVSLGAPDTIDSSQQLAYITFFNQLPYVIPCSSCAQHLLENMGKTSVSLETAAKKGREGLFAWSVELHNIVNRMLKKPEMSAEKARDHWTRGCARGPQECIRSTNASSAKISAVGLAIMWVCIGILLGGLGLGYLKKGRQSR